VLYIMQIHTHTCMQDRAIAQLEEALASRQRAIEQLIAATSSTEQLNTELQDRDAQVCGWWGVKGCFGVCVCVCVSVCVCVCMCVCVCEHACHLQHGAAQQSC